MAADSAIGGAGDPAAVADRQLACACGADAEVVTDFSQRAGPRDRYRAVGAGLAAYVAIPVGHRAAAADLQLARAQSAASSAASARRRKERR